MSHVRITLQPSQVFREDVGLGDATDKLFSQAAAHALKSSITDGLKRAARHFGDRLGNSLYESSFSLAKAPKTQWESLEEWDKRFREKYESTSHHGSGGHGGGNNNNSSNNHRQASGNAVAAARKRMRNSGHHGGVVVVFVCFFVFALATN
jgi:recombination DNA repair RAD52 pathway protein